MGLTLLLLGLSHLASPGFAAQDAPLDGPPDGPVAAGASPEPAAGSVAGSAGGPMAVPASRSMSNAAIITIGGPINAVTAASVKRRIDAAINGGADGIIIELNTPGGEVGAVLEITRVIKSLSVPTIAWVNSEAISGGAIIAIACNSIVGSQNAVMGDAAPIAFDPMKALLGQVSQLSSSERAKILSPLLAEVVDSARRNGHDENLVQAFLMLGVETWMVEDTQTGRMYFLTRDEYKELFGTEPVAVSPIMPGIAANEGAGALTASEEAEQQGAARGRENETDSPLNPPMPRGLGTGEGFQPATDLPQDLVDSVSLSLETRSTRPDFSRADPARYRSVRYATDGTALLTLGATDLQEVQLVDPNLFINTREEMANYVGATNVRVLDQTWSESVVEFMTQGISGMLIRAVLIIAFLLGLFIELAMPGIGIAGVIAVVALLGLVVPPLLINAAMWWTIAAILLGVSLILLEIFVFPGFGIPGVSGVVLVLLGIVGTFASAGELFPGAGTGTDSSLAGSLAVVLLSLFGAGVGAYLFTRYTKFVPFTNLLVLTESGRSPGADAPSFLEAMAPAAVYGKLKVGDVGIATTPLRPSGSMEFGDDLFDVVSGFGMIDTGTRVRVVSLSDNRVVVEPAAPDAATGPEGREARDHEAQNDNVDSDDQDGEEVVPHA